MSMHKLCIPRGVIASEQRERGNPATGVGAPGRWIATLRDASLAMTHERRAAILYNDCK